MNIIYKQMANTIKRLKEEAKHWYLLAESSARCIAYWHDECLKLQNDTEHYKQGFIKDNNDKWVRNDFAAQNEVLAKENVEFEEKLKQLRKSCHEENMQEFNLRIETEHKVVQARIIIQGLLDALADKEQGVVYGKDTVMLLEEAREWVARNKKKE